MSKERFYNIIRGPAITEKGTLVCEKNQIGFNVAWRATRPHITPAVEGLFGVKVKAVNTLSRKGKARRYRGIPTILSDVKKAYVTLEEGQRLDVTTGL